MIPPGIPEDERQRLKALRALDVLDTALEERFERITNLATRLLEAPIGVLSLVDETREWYKSCQGLEIREGAREVSFCGHAILSDSILVIPDASKDERFKDNPQVTGPLKIRFYAGCPLKSVEGYRVGTLCIKDRKPRELDDAQRGLLGGLARWAELELNFMILKRTYAQLDQEQHKLRQSRDVLASLNSQIINHEQQMLALKRESNDLLTARGQAPKYAP